MHAHLYIHLTHTNTHIQGNIQMGVSTCVDTIVCEIYLNKYVFFLRKHLEIFKNKESIPILGEVKKVSLRKYLMEIPEY